MLCYSFETGHGQLAVSVHWVRSQDSVLFWLVQMKVGCKSAALCQFCPGSLRADISCLRHRLLLLSGRLLLILRLVTKLGNRVVSEK